MMPAVIDRRPRLDPSRPFVAWNGGSRPRPLSTLTSAERRDVSALFREQVSTWWHYWQVTPEWELLRLFWKRARYDAYATHRAMPVENC